MTVYLGVGSNIEPEKNILRGLELLQNRGIRIESVSLHYSTAALRHRDQPRYINGVWLIRGYEGDAPELKIILKEVEASCGRIRTGDPYSSRTLDLDILVTEDYASDEILSRDFIFIPLLELNSDLELPGYGKLKEQVDLNRREQMHPLTEFTEKLRRIIGE